MTAPPEPVAAPPDPAAAPPGFSADAARGWIVLDWGLSGHFARLALVAVVGLTVAVAFGQLDLLALATPCLYAVLLGLRRPPEAPLGLVVDATPRRLFEGEELRVRGSVEPGASARLEGVRLRWRPGVGLGPPRAPEPEVPSATRDARSGPTLEAVCRVQRWGLRALGVVGVDTIACDGLLRGRGTWSPPLAVVAFPRPVPVESSSTPVLTRARVGEHRSLQAGRGTEFAAVRPFAFGDSPRQVNWAATARTGSLHVNDAVAERAVEIVVILDALSDAAIPGGRLLDRGVRTAAGVTEAWLATRDRVGVVVLGGGLRWVRPSSARRTFYEVVEAVIACERTVSYVDPKLLRVPPAVLPPGALLVFVSPLLDERALAAVRDLRGRRYATVVLDTLGDTLPPLPPGRSEKVATLLFRARRELLLHDVRAVGAPTVAWSSQTDLGVGLAAALTTPGLGRS